MYQRRKFESTYFLTFRKVGKMLLAIGIILSIAIAGCTKDKILQSSGLEEEDPLVKAGIEEIEPGNQADSVAINPVVSITYASGTDEATVTSTSVTLSNGATSIDGTISVSGNTASFTFDHDLNPMTEYNAEVTTTWKDGYSGRNESMEYSWRFRTGSHRRNGSLSIVSVEPANNATEVPAASNLKITFNQELTTQIQGMISVSLKKGYTPVQGSLSFAGKIATFTPANSLSPGTKYTAAVSLGSDHDGDDDDDDGDDDDKSGYSYWWSFTTAASGGGTTDNTAPAVNSVTPANNATAVAVGTTLSATFSEALDPATVTSTTFTLKQGTNAVAGTVTYSSNVATFTPSAALSAGLVYTASITTGVKDVAGNSLAANYSWSFTTASATSTDVTAPTVTAVTPAANATGIAANSTLTVRFSEAMTASTISAATVTLKQGTATVAGSVSYSSATNTATFTPSAALAANNSYSATVTTGVKDAAGNALAANYTWSFTTAAAADVTAPTVAAVTPAANATGIAVNSALTVRFSESMTASTISATTITLKQGTASVTGTVTYTAGTNTATFTPGAALTGNTVYTATVTTGVKDAAGNALASNYTWSFTTVTVATGVSFANEIVAILNKCNTCHTHGWTVSTNASTFYTNLVNGGYVNTTTPTSGRLYTQVNGGHPSSTVTTAEKNKILQWVTEGSKNN